MLPAGRRPEAGRHHDRPDRAPRAGRDRDLESRRRPGFRAPRPPAAVDHRPERRGQPAVVQGRPDARLQRRALQLQGAAGRPGRPAACASSPSPTPRSCSRPGGPGDRRRCAGSAACSRSRWPTRRPAIWSWPVTRSASSRSTTCRAATGVLFASELKALLAAVGPELRIDPGAMVASMLYYWVPEQQCAIEGVQQAPARLVGADPPGRAAVRPALLADRGRGGRGRGRPGPPTCAAVIEESVARAPGGRRAGVELPVRRPGLEHRHRAGASGRPGDRRLHHHLPARRPAARGHARRRGLRPEGRGAVRHRAARDRDRAGHRRPAAPHGRRARRADRRPGRDQHAAHVRGRARARCQGDPVRHGRRRAVRRLPQAPRLRDGQPVQRAARLAPGRRAVRGGPAAGQRRRPRPALRALGQALPDLRRAAGGAEVPAQLHAVRPGRAGRASSVPAWPATSTR